MTEDTAHAQNHIDYDTINKEIARLRKEAEELTKELTSNANEQPGDNAPAPPAETRAPATGYDNGNSIIKGAIHSRQAPDFSSVLAMLSDAREKQLKARETLLAVQDSLDSALASKVFDGIDDAEAAGYAKADREENALDNDVEARTAALLENDHAIDERVRIVIEGIARASDDIAEDDEEPNDSASGR